VRRTTVISTIALAMTSVLVAPAAAGATGASSVDPPGIGEEPTPVVEEGAAEAAVPESTEAGRTITIFSGSDYLAANHYWEIPHRGPGNLVSPVNYVRGNAVLRVSVNKPSTKRVLLQICAWRNSFNQETCSKGYAVSARSGSYTFNLGAPQGWWKKGGWTWTKPYNPIRIMVKDAATGKLMMTSRCGRACSKPSAVKGHLPIRMTGTLTFSSR
jgi:hypothetical protein